MNVLLRLYYLVPNFQNKSILSKLLNRSMEKVLKTWFDYYSPIYFHLTKSNPKHALATEYSKVESSDLVIASITSFPARIAHTYISIECILRQSVKPHKIILWLAEEQFPEGLSSLPQKLLEQTKRGLEIRFCDDIRSHKKYYYALLEYPQSKIVLFDDDLYYHKDMIKDLVALQAKHPHCIIASRAHKMKFKGNQLLPYLQWEHNYNEELPSVYLHHTSGNGTLIPGNSLLDATFFDKDLLMKLSPKSDDVWFKVNLLRLQVKVVTNSKYNKDPISVKTAHKTSLVSTNSFKGEKDKQLQACFDYFKISF